MNSRITILFFALLLTTLWIFGLMIAHSKGKGDRGFAVPSLRKDDVKIDKIVVKHKEGGKEVERTFENIGDRWFLKEKNEQVRVEGFRIESLIRQIKEARHDETADIENVRIDNPDVTVTLFGKAQAEPKEWKFFVGKEVAGLLYVGSSDQEGKVFAVPKQSLSSLEFANANNFRSKKLFDFVDVGVTRILVKKDDKELELKRGENSMWTFVKPPLGFAGFDAAEPPPEPKNPHEPPKPPPAATSGVKALLSSIMNVRVEDDDDFEPLGSRPLAEYGLETGKAAMKIEIVSTAEKGEKKDTSSEILLIGLQNKARKGTYYYARLAEDQGVFQVSSKWLDPIDKAVNDPGKIRSLDIAVFDEAKVDAVTFAHGKDDFKFFKVESKDKDEQMPFPVPGQKSWEMIVGSEKKKASDKAVHTLLEHVLGKKAIVAFLDLAPDADAKKKDAEWGFDAPTAVIAVYVNGIEKEKEKKDEAKDEKDKKDEKEKKEAKKDEKDKKDALPALKKDAKAVVTLVIGKIDKETVNVKRTLEDGTTVSRFTVKKEWLDKIVPSEGTALAYLDTSLPEFPAGAVTALKLERKTDKGTESIELERHTGEHGALWYVKDPLEPTGLKLADTNMVDQVVKEMARMPAEKWLKTIGDKEDLEKYGLKNPVAVISVTVKKNPETAASAAGVRAMLATPFNAPLFAAAFAIASRQADKGEVISITFGKETDQEKDKPNIFAMHSGSKMLFLVPPHPVKFVKETDFRDRAVLMLVQGRMVASYLASAAVEPIGLLMLGSPHISGQIFNLDPDKVKEVRLEVRDRYELRTFYFLRDAKDKSWTDKSNIPEFKLDADKVTQLVKEIAKLKADRFVAFAGGPRGEHKLGAKEATVKLDLILDDGRIVTLMIGANFQNAFYATTSIWPETVFMLPSAVVEPMLKGAAQFARERVGAN